MRCKMCWQYLSLPNALKNWCLIFCDVPVMIQEICHVVQAVLSHGSHKCCGVTGSSKGLRWSRLSYKASPNLSDPDPEQPSSAINGHLNPGGGQQNTLLLCCPGRKASRHEKLFFGIKLNLSSILNLCIWPTMRMYIFEKKWELVLFRLRLVWVNLGEVIRV